MISAVEGFVECKGPDWVMLKLGGVSLQLRVPVSSLRQLGAVGEKIRLMTHLHVKEDSMVLYGFVSQQELDMFRLLMSVNSVGPRLALTLLSSLSPDQLATAIRTGNVGAITQVPGVGRKIASRVVVELKSKLDGETTGVAPFLVGDTSEVVAALTNLGYSVAEAARAAAELPQTPDLSLEEKVRTALRSLGG